MNNIEELRTQTNKQRQNEAFRLITKELESFKPSKFRFGA